MLVKVKDRKYVECEGDTTYVAAQNSGKGCDNKINGRSEREKFVTRRKKWKLRDAEMRKVFEVKVAESWGSGCKDGDVRERYSDCVLTTADEVCGWTKGKCGHGEM